MSADLLEGRGPRCAREADRYAAIKKPIILLGLPIGVTSASRRVMRMRIMSDAAKDRLREKGAQFRNERYRHRLRQPVVGVRACTGGRGSKTFFLSLACNRSCYFCFNANQADYADRLRVNDAWRDEGRYVRRCVRRRGHPCRGLTGGEPLLHADGPWRSALTFASAFRVPISGCTPPAISLTNRCSIACATPGSTSCA